MSSEKPTPNDWDETTRQVSDESLRKASEGPVRHLPDALFGGPAPVRPSEEPADAQTRAPGAEHGGAVSDELLRKASEGPVRHLPDLLFGGPVPEPVAQEENSGSDEPRPAGGAEVADDADAAPVAEEGAVAGGSGRPVLLVIADSLAYFGPRGGLPADDPRIWPNLVASELDWDVELIGRIGWTCRDAYWALIGDPRVWAAVPRAGAVVFATGGMDSLPSPLPTALRELIRYVRPPSVRRRVREGYNWLQPRLSKLGRPVALPPHVSIDYLEQCRISLAQLRPELPMVGVLPSVHDCEAYGRVHTGREPAVRALREWSAKTAVPLVDLGEAVRDNVFRGESNPDGIHWGWEGHTAVARAMVKVISEVSC